ncbi:MAG: MarR family winged helix-turn-helix transcriptional regulator [Streptosporangiaceae bacterium]
MEVAGHETGGVSKAWALPMAEEEAQSEQASPVDRTCAGGVARPGHGDSAGWIWGDAEAGIPADAPLHLLMLAASRVMTAYYVSTLAQAGVQVSPAGLGVLRILLNGDGLKSSDVAARGWSSPGTLTSVVNTLVREGYVERRSDAGDRRVVRLYLTDQGRRTCEDYYALAGPAWRDAFDFVNDADEPVVRKFFTDMIYQFSELARKERTR